VIRKKFLKFYLEQHLEEYLALGGLKELIDREPMIAAGVKLLDPLTNSGQRVITKLI
jgi:hypothetical protein